MHAEQAQSSWMTVHRPFYADRHNGEGSLTTDAHWAIGLNEAM